MKDWKTAILFAVIFLVAYFAPLSDPRVHVALAEALDMVQWYARNHTLACVVPALFIAGGIVTFLSKEAVLRHLGPKAKKLEAYSVASISGTSLAVCSCSVLPMFAGIYRVGAGLGPASAFLYAGPAINILALFLTARVLGFELGAARAVGAILFGIVIGLLMALIFRRSERARQGQLAPTVDVHMSARPLWKTGLYFACMIGFLIFSDWYNPGHVTLRLVDGTELSAVVMQETRDEIVVQLEKSAGDHAKGERLTLSKSDVASTSDNSGWVMTVYHFKWYLAGMMGLAVLLMVWRWFDRVEVSAWLRNTWDFAKLLVPLLFGGVFLVGFLGALLPDERVASLVGDNGILSNLFASIVGCMFYFATLTEIPILQALMDHGMHKGPALALLLAGPALSLPSLLVIRRVIGNAKTAVFTSLVIVMAAVAGKVFGAIG